MDFAKTREVSEVGAEVREDMEDDGVGVEREVERDDGARGTAKHGAETANKGLEADISCPVVNWVESKPRIELNRAGDDAGRDVLSKNVKCAPLPRKIAAKVCSEVKNGSRW